MKLIKLTMATLGIGVIAMSSSIAQARTGVTIDIGLGIPLFRAPVYYSPPPVYYSPPPVYYAPPRVVYERRTNYPQPIYYGNRWEPRGYEYARGHDRRGHDDDDCDEQGDRDYYGRPDRGDGRGHGDSGRWQRR